MGPKFYSFLLITVIFENAFTQKTTPCLKRYYNQNSFVCVCNSTQCDTIEPLDYNLDDRNTFYQEYVTSKSQYRLEKFVLKFNVEPSATSRLNLTLNRSKKYQKIFGFGGAMTDATGLNVLSLSSKTIQNFLGSYFSPNGIEYNIIRVPVAGCDFSNRTYSYDDYANDFDLSNFSLSYEDTQLKIPLIQWAQKMSVKNVRLFASAWSAPPWMKTNNDFKGNGTLIGPPGGLYYQTWANYYLKFFEAYKKHNLSFWAMTAQNEPTDGNIYNFFFNALGFTPETQAEFIITNLGPTLEKNGFGNIQIMILDDQRLFLPTWVDRVFEYNREKANKYVSGIAVHWYLNSVVPVKTLDITHERYPNKWIFGSEACAGVNPFSAHVQLGGYNRAENYAHYIIEDLNNWVTGWTDWNMALDLKGGPNWSNNFVEAAVIVNATADEFYKQPIFYIMGHFSKFIVEDCVRIDLLLVNSDLNKQKKVSYIAFENDQLRQTVVVLLNESDQSFEFSIYDPLIQKYVNSMSDAHSIKTIVWFY